MTVYVDILIILNVIVNYFILLAVNKITRNHATRWRLCAGALVGGISSLLLFLENLGIIMTALKIVSGIIMVLISFKFKSIKTFARNVFWLFAICACFGGVTFLLYMLLKVDLMIYTNGIVYFDISLTFLVVATVVSYGVITVICKLTDKKAPKEKEYYVTIQKNGKFVSCMGLMDTGNNLREPFSDYPVVLMDKKMFEELIGKVLCLDDIEENDKIRLIPLWTVNGSSLVKAFRPDLIKIGGFETDKVFVAESEAPLNEYKILLNINLEGEMQNVKT